MILMISGRTDIIAYYTTWFLNRLKEGFVDVRNPINPNLVSRIYFKDVSLIVFCTKNPNPIIPYLKDLKIPYLFHVTLTSYNKDIEVNVIDKIKVIEGIKEISRLNGIDNIYLRYDPILLNDRYDKAYHYKAFDKLNKLLLGYVNKYIISFIDDYKNVREHKDTLKLKDISFSDMKEMSINLSKIAKHYNNVVFACGESKELLNYGLDKGECVSLKDAYRLTGKLDFKKQNIRKNINCNCLMTVDIGAYNSCFNLCKYCYANFDESLIKTNILNHDVNSSLLIGHLKETDFIKVRHK